MDKKSLCWHSRVENMCQWHPSQTPWERKWEAKRENNWKIRGKQNWLLKRSGAVANSENKNGHEMVAVCQGRPGDGSELPFLIQGGKCALCALCLAVEHLRCTSRVISELCFELFRSEVISCEVKQ